MAASPKGAYVEGYVYAAPVATEEGGGVADSAEIAHVVLLFLVTAKNTDLFDVTIKKTTQYGITKRSGASGDKEDFIFEDGHIKILLFIQ